MPGREAIAPDRLLTVSLDELLLVPTRPALRPLCQFLDVYLQQRMRAYFQREMSAERANTERWRQGVSPRRAVELERAYGEVVAGLEADRVRCAPLVRRTLERPGPGRRGAGAAPVRDRRRASAGSLGEAGGRRRSGRTVSDLVFVGGTGRSGTPRDRQAARPALALRDDPDRVPLPLQSERPRGRRHRQGDPGGVRGQAARVLVAPGPSRRARPGPGSVAGAARRQGAWPPQDHCPRAL